MRPFLSGRSHSLYRAATAFFCRDAGSTAVLSIFLVFICLVLSGHHCRFIIALLLPRSVAGHVYKSGPFAPVVVQIDLHGCKLWVSAPVDFQSDNHVCKTAPFAHVMLLFGRHPKCWTDPTIINMSMRSDCLSEGSVTKATALFVKCDVGQRSGDRTQHNLVK